MRTSKHARLGLLREARRRWSGARCSELVVARTQIRREKGGARRGVRTWGPTPISPAGTSVSCPMCLHSSVMNAWQKRMISMSLLPLGSKSEPPLPPARGEGHAL